MRNSIQEKYVVDQLQMPIANDLQDLISVFKTNSDNMLQRV
jgi:hypothetical protein